MHRFYYLPTLPGTVLWMPQVWLVSLNNNINGLSSVDRTHHSLSTISLIRNFDYISLSSFV